MKKLFLLFVAAVGLSTTAKAQFVAAPDFKQEAGKMVVESTEAAAMEQVAGIPSAAGPMRGVANGIWYQRPKGTYLQTTSTYRYIIVPPFTELTWTNKSSEPENTIWAYGANAGTHYKESYIVDNNLVNSYSKNVGTGAYAGPFVLVENVDTFAIIDSQLSTGYPLVIAPDTIRTLNAQVPATSTSSGFTDLMYGTTLPVTADRDGVSDSYVVSRVIEYFDAPAQPYYLEGISFYASVQNSANVTEPLDPSSEGVTCRVVQADEEGNYTEELAIIPINRTDAEVAEFKPGYYTPVKAYCMKTDEFGGMVQQPVVIERDFVLIFEGFTREGVRFGIQMSRMPVEEMYHNGGAYPTVYETIWTSDGAVRGTYYQYNSKTDYQRNIIVRLNGMWDVVAVDEACLEMTAPVEGGQITAPGDDGEGNTVDYPGVYIQSVFPYQTDMSPMPSYEIENLPEWLSISSYDDQYYVANYGWTTVVNIEAAPLPEGEDGRTATLRFVSEMGAKSKEFTVTQGTPVPTAIQDVETATDENAAALEYNLAGQRVGKDYKGIVVKNGKKMVVK